MMTFKGLDYLLLCADSTLLFTEHLIILFVVVICDLNQIHACHKVSKVIHLEQTHTLSHFSYITELVYGEINIITYILTRSIRDYHGNINDVKIVSHILLEYSIIPIPSDDAFEFPEKRSVRGSQQNHVSQRPETTYHRDDFIWITNGRMGPRIRLWTTTAPVAHIVLS